MKKILIVEDDAAIVLGLEDAIQSEGYETRIARTGQEGLRTIFDWKPDLIVLDIMLPGMSGFEICKRIRDRQVMTPVIMLTSKNEETDKVLGLELGADDYVTKPFSLRELLARIKAHLRREEASAPKNDEATIPEDKFTFGDVVVDFKRHEVYKNGVLQDMTHKEFQLLEYFLKHPGEVLTRDRLLEKIWGYDVYPTTRTVDNHVLRLRKHIEPNPENPVYIKTIRGAGYLFELNGYAPRGQHS
ncbi:MAG: response regulator transcription factor [candidate division KSB1 bacterium]|nr:response regulator transcription factor [candidate division KSB1 bacterium]MDQ7065419.1 response regulator transcription factor [candidate division KSB1 bacterium]